MENKKNASNSVRQKVSYLLTNYSTISLFIGISLILLSITWDYFGKDSYVIDNYKIVDLSEENLKKLNYDQLEVLGDKYLDVYKSRKEHYTKSSSALSTIVNSLGVCCLIAILVLYYKSKDSISIAGVDLPIQAVFLILPILMLYLWLSFGFTYFSALDSRNICFIAGVKYERVVDLQAVAADTNNHKKFPDGINPNLEHPFSIIHNLEDMGIIDGSVHVFNGLYSEFVYNIFYHNRESCFDNKDDSVSFMIDIGPKVPHFSIFDSFAKKDGPERVSLHIIKKDPNFCVVDSVAKKDGPESVTLRMIKKGPNFWIVDSLANKKVPESVSLRMIKNGLNFCIIYSDPNKDDSKSIRIPTGKKGSLFWIVGSSLFLIFGTLLGISLGFIITLLIRFQHLKNTNTFYAKCLVLTVFILLCLSFFGFLKAKEYFVSFIGYMWIIASIVIYIYVVRLRNSAEFED
jgi:hypothetical protein